MCYKECHCNRNRVCLNDPAIVQINSVTGWTGPTGPFGPQGLRGFVGATGPTGETGYTGYTGYTGVTGYTGIDGATGATGIAGAIGPTGFTGAVGATGFTGAVGATGFTGALGPTGPAPTSGLFSVGITGGVVPIGPSGEIGPFALITQPFYNFSGGALSLTAGEFTVPTNGRYRFTLTVNNVSAIAGGYAYAVIWYNGLPIVFGLDPLNPLLEPVGPIVYSGPYSLTGAAPQSISLTADLDLVIGELVFPLIWASNVATYGSVFWSAIRLA